MINLSEKRLLDIIDNFKNYNVAVVGDMMLDGYLWGDVQRISPEAPVPIVEIDNEFFRFGGAANVALNISKLGCNPIPIGVIGDDRNGEIFKELLHKANMNSELLINDSSRSTTTKTRVISADQQIVRIDKEDKQKISKEIEEKIISSLKSNIEEIDGIILEDYNKGVLSSTLIEDIITLANENNKVVTVDPKFDNFF